MSDSRKGWFFVPQSAVTRAEWLRRGRIAALIAVALPLAASAVAQMPSSSGTTAPVEIPQPAIDSTTYQGSVAHGQATQGVLRLSLSDAIQLGLKYNLGLLLTRQNVESARADRLEELQGLLPTVTAKVQEADEESDLQAEGLRIPGFPAIIGPYGYTDIRGTLKWSLVDLPSLENYLASRHDFQSATLSLQDARDMVVLTVGNAYLTVIADAGRIEAVQAQVATSKVSLNQAVQNHQAGVSPLLDELRARVDYQTQEQALIAARDSWAKDKLALARAIGLPLDQKFELSSPEPYAPLDHLQPEAAVAEALANRADYKALEQEVAAAKNARKAATYERLPTVSFSGDYGDIGINVAHSHGTGDAVGSLDMPLFEEGKLRGDAKQAQAQLDEDQAQLSNLRGQIAASVRDAILDIQAAEKLVSVAHSNVQLAKEALSEAQQRYKAGVSDNLAVSQAQQAVAQANDQYVNALYEHNVAKLSLARALGVAQSSYENYLGGK